MEPYEIPYYQKSSLKLSMKLLYLFCTIFMLAGAVGFFYMVSPDEMAVPLFFGVFFLALAILFGYMFIAVGVLRKFHIEMTSEYFEVSSLFKNHKANWRDICDVNVYEYNNNLMLGILLKKDKNKKKKTLNGSFSSVMNIPQCSFQMAFNVFGEVDVNRLLFTIGQQIDKHASENNIDVEAMVDKNEGEDNNLIKAIIFSALSCIGMTLIYGITIFLFKKNYVAIPIFCSLLIIAVFNKYYLEKSFNIMIRLYLAIICLIQVPAAIIGEIMAVEKIEFTLINIADITKEYFKYIYHNPSKQVWVIVVSIICISMGALKGRYTSKKDKNLNQAQ